MGYPNRFRGDKWILSFAGIPTVKDRKDLRLFDDYIKSVTFPDYNMEEITSEGEFGMNIRHPKAGMQINKNLSQLQIEFFVSEDMQNYLYFMKWMLELKYGQLDGGNYDGMIRDYNIPVINLILLDNEKRTTAIIKFTKAFLLNLSSMPMTFGTSDEVVFTANFSYEEMLYEQKNPMTGSTNPSAPELGIPCGDGPLPLDVSATWS